MTQAARGWSSLQVAWHNVIGGYGPALGTPQTLPGTEKAWEYSALSDLFSLDAAGVVCVDIEAHVGRIGLFLTDADCGASLSRNIAVMDQRAWVPLKAPAGDYRIVVCNFDDDGTPAKFTVHGAEMATGQDYGPSQAATYTERCFRLLDPANAAVRWRAMATT